ncbi:cytochrome D1 domain-containing protein [Cupriavidus sp. RAF12]|uniref:cytochrome D1 domain-containing protein n=1 Tax=Cupriavidus sp. RAF12 TaxID=3233050 RepID=UPI003F92820D
MRAITATLRMARIAMVGLGVLAVCLSARAQPDSTALAPGALYQQHCAVCHGTDRLGGMGPALLPQSLERLKAKELDEVLRQGREATQMPGFATQIPAVALEQLARWLRTEPTESPHWTADEIRASRVVLHADGTLPAKPVFRADPANLFLVVEAGSHHLSVLDGDRLEPIHRFATRFALHGGPKFSRDGRYVFVASRDGWISKFDLWNLSLVAEIRVGLNTRNVAVSDDGKWVLAGNTLPANMVLLDARDLALARVYPVQDADGMPSRVSAVYDAAPRGSFIAALRDIPEVWEIPYGNVPDALVPRKIRLDAVLDDFFFDPPYRHILGASRTGGGQVIDLDAGHKVATLALQGMPHLGSGITWERNGQSVMVSPNLKQAAISVIDMGDWHTVATIPTAGPGFFLRSHEQTPYAWTDAMMSPHRDTLQVIDKQSLRVVGSVTPAPGHTAAHVEFTRDGRYALVSLMERDGAIVVYDATTLREVKRIPMDKPIGKYNVFNKTTRSSGTSH